MSEEIGDDMPLYTYQPKANGKPVSILFIHIPKCGGTTIQNLFDHLGFKTFLAPKEYKHVRSLLKIPPHHFDMSWIEPLIRLEMIYSFAIIRNPYDRLMSDFKWARKHSSLREKFRKMSFEEFILDCFEQHEQNRIYLANHITPQHEFISEKVSKIFKLEQGLEHAITQVFSDVGLEFNKELVLPKMNQSDPAQLEITKNARRLIFDFYEKDFTRFGYDPDL